MPILLLLLQIALLQTYLHITLVLHCYFLPFRKKNENVRSKIYHDVAKLILKKNMNCYKLFINNCKVYVSLKPTNLFSIHFALNLTWTQVVAKLSSVEIHLVFHLWQHNPLWLLVCLMEETLVCLNIGYCFSSDWWLCFTCVHATQNLFLFLNVCEF